MKPSNRVFYLPYELYVKFIHEGKLKNHKYCHHTGFYLNNEFRFGRYTIFCLLTVFPSLFLT